MNTPEFKRDTAWDFENITALLYGNIGYAYGKNPAEHLETIRQQRAKFGDWISEALQLQPDDVVADLGSGLGLLASHIAPRVSTLHCMDISQPFLEECRKGMSACPNAQFHLIPFADLSCLADQGVNKLYSTAVFIHFNIYDVWLYLKECAKYLTPGGLLGFDFADADRLNPAGPDWNDHVEMYKKDRAQVVLCMNYHSLSGIDHLLALTGFERLKVYSWERSNFVVCKKL